MKISDLMTGDYVLVTEDNNEYIGKVEAVNAITNYCVVFIGGDSHGNHHDVFIEDIQPIPLTKEVFLSLGFIQKKNWLQRGNFGDMPLMMWWTQEDTILNRHCVHELELHNLSDGKEHFSMYKKCEYVHLLQHYLKNCEIELDITYENICSHNTNQ